MQTVGIICEYNPLHLGHKKQLDAIRARYGESCAIVCLMSGHFVQRGHPAIVDKMLRARAALQSGADLVLELPVTVALSSAEGFAAGGVAILSRLCNVLCFGAETADKTALTAVAKALLSGEFPQILRAHLDTGLSFPAARQAALREMGLDSGILETPNNILAVEYCKAIIAQGSSMEIFPIARLGSYHDARVDDAEPSATAVRALMEGKEPWQRYVPQGAQDVFSGAEIHTLRRGEKAMLYRLRTMTDAEFEALPYGSEGLWRKFMHACRSQATLEEILAATKSKRYTRSRLDRMVMCAFLGLTAEDLAAPPPYCRVLGFNSRGRAVLGAAKDTGFFPNIGRDMRHPYQAIEYRCGDLYGLFAAEPAEAGQEKACRVCYLGENVAEIENRV